MFAWFQTVMILPFGKGKAVREDRVAKVIDKLKASIKTASLNTHAVIVAINAVMRNHRDGVADMKHVTVSVYEHWTNHAAHT